MPIISEFFIDKKFEVQWADEDNKLVEMIAYFRGIDETGKYKFDGQDFTIALAPVKLWNINCIE